MVWDLLLGSLLSSVAGLTLALVTAALTDHREKRRWLQTKVHQPMYGELTNAISGEAPWATEEYASLWADLDYYKTYRVDVELAETLDRYASAVSELARCEHDADVAAFVAALPPKICDSEGVAELPSGRSVDMETWFRRNALVLATDPGLRGTEVEVQPAALAYLWTEVDGIDPAGADGPVDTATVLEAVSTEFNWGYEGFYRHWDAGWADDLVAALRAATERDDSAVDELLARRRAVGEVASEARDHIEVRAERGLFRSLWHEWTTR